MTMTTQRVSNAFPRETRLVTSSQYKRVFDRPIKFHTQTFSVLARQNEIAHARLGLAISKKAVNTAVARNRLKRVVRESFRKRRDELPAYDFVILARRGMADLTSGQLDALLQKAWMKFERDAKNH